MQLKCFCKSLNHDALLILTGVGGSVFGYENKYETMAKNMFEKHKLNVFVAPIPSGVWQKPQEIYDEIIEELSLQMQEISKEYNIYAMGTSAGANLVLWHAFQTKNIKQVLAINPVLNLNIHKTNQGVEKFENDFIHIVVGENDEASWCINWIKDNQKLRKTTLKDVDHQFVGKLDEFIALPIEHFEI